MKPGLKLYLTGAGIAVLGVVCGVIMENTDTGSVFGFLMLGLLIVAAAVMVLGTYAMQNPNSRLPVGKVIVCALAMVVGAALAGVLAVVCSGGSGWIPVGYTGVMAAIPLCLAFAFCLWYWNK